MPTNYTTRKKMDKFLETDNIPRLNHGERIFEQTDYL